MNRDVYEHKITEYKRSLIQELFDKLPVDQQERFIRWSKGINAIKKDHLRSSYYLLDRSVKKNIKLDLINKEE